MTLIALVIAYLTLGTFAASLGYHRYLTHRAFSLRYGLGYLLVFLGLPAGTPVQWAGNHRYHHLHCDTRLDPHSPLHGGFWWAHCGWYLGTRKTWLAILYAAAGPLRLVWDSIWRPRSNQEHVTLAQDIRKDSVLRFFSHPGVYGASLLAHFLVPAALFYFVAGGMGIAAWYLALVAMYNFGDAVDSVGHLYGTRLSDGDCHARNNRWLAYLTAGDGWHANHHVHPSRARHGSENWQFDLNWVLIRALEKLGIAYHVKR